MIAFKVMVVFVTMGMPKIAGKFSYLVFEF